MQNVMQALYLTRNARGLPASARRYNFGPVEYISSAGLRVLLSAQKLMNRQGKMVLTHVSESVMEIFEVTGFSDILTIE